MPTPRQSRPTEPPGARSTEPGHGGMWACRPTAFGGGAAGIEGLFGRPYRPPLRTRLRASRRGGLYARPCRTGGFRGVGILDRRAGCPHPAKAGRRNHQARGPRNPAMAACGHAALRRSAGVRRESEACPGGHTGRPYGPSFELLVGAGLMPARAAPPCRMHPHQSHCTVGAPMARPYPADAITGAGSVPAPVFAAAVRRPGKKSPWKPHHFSHSFLVSRK